MKQFKKLTFLAATTLLSLALLASGCGSSTPENNKDGSKSVTITVGATPVPHSEILNEIKPLLAKEGVNLKIVEFTDYVKPNLALADKELDANFFQHKPYLDKFDAEHDIFRKIFSAEQLLLQVFNISFPIKIMAC